MPKQVKITVPTVDEILPEEFRKHMLQAYKECLLAFKSLIDEQVRKVEELESGKERKVVKRIEIE
ncbi:MAG TPA: hypothetical protein EYP30_02760 [Archaeoglobaceae archaeon]|nr:hypothetical protein [Archaeoglobaceae archaeon]